MILVSIGQRTMVGIWENLLKDVLAKTEVVNVHTFGINSAD